MAEKPTTFRTAVGGFHKADVLSYIEKAEFTFQKELSELKTKNEQLTAALAAAEKKSTEAEVLRMDADNLQAENKKLREEIAALKQQNEEANAAIDAKAEEIASLSRVTEENAVQVALPENFEEIKTKAQLYDNLSLQLGDILVSAASKSADTISVEAQKKADEVLSVANQRATETEAAAVAYVRTFTESIELKIKEISQTYYDDLALDTAELSERLNALASEIKAKTDNFAAKSESVKKLMEDETAAAAADLSAKISALKA